MFYTSILPYNELSGGKNHVEDQANFPVFCNHVFHHFVVNSCKTVRELRFMIYGLYQEDLFCRHFWVRSMAIVLSHTAFPPLSLTPCLLQLTMKKTNSFCKFGSNLMTMQFHRSMFFNQSALSLKTILILQAPKPSNKPSKTGGMCSYNCRMRYEKWL